MVKLVAEPETVVKIRRVAAERETPLEFTIRVGAEPETVAKITAGWLQMATKPTQFIEFLEKTQRVPHFSPKV